MQRKRAAVRLATAAGLLFAMLSLSGCADVGLSGVDAELDRIQGERGFAVTSSAPERAVFRARGQRIVVEPPKGYCLEPDAVEVTRRSAFALIADCLSDQQAQVAQVSGTGEAVAINLPRTFPGIMTVSISGDPAIGPEPQAIDAFEALLRSEAGRSLLNRGNNSGAGTIVATRRTGRALYVLIDEAPGQTTFLSPRFWRGFIEINERLVLVTVSSFSDRPIAADGMLAFLASQIAQLRRANGLNADFDEDGIAGQLASFVTDAPDTGIEVVRSETGAVTEDGIAPASSPRPLLRADAPETPRGKGFASPIPPPRTTRIAMPVPVAESGSTAVPAPPVPSSSTAVAEPRSTSTAAPNTAPIAPKRLR